MKSCEFTASLGRNETCWVIRVKKPVLILQQLEYEPPALIGESIRQAGFPIHTIMTMEENIPPALGDYSGLVIMGGHMSANDEHLDFIRQQIRLLQWCIHYDFPVLGICLGAQLLARAGGGCILPSPIRELGWHPIQPTFLSDEDPLFADILIEDINVFQWHGETFTLPDEAMLLATANEVPNQAFRMRSRLYGLQFHAEITEELIGQWLRHGTSESAWLGQEGIQKLLRDIPRYLPVARIFCRQLVTRWLKLF